MKRIALLAALALSTVANAQVKISELPAAGALTGAEISPVVQSGTTARTEVNEIGSYTIGRIIANTNVWSGSNTYTGYVTFTGPGTAANPTVRLSANIPELEWFVSNGNANTKRWMTWANVTNMHYSLCNDAGNSCNDYFTIVHDGVGTPTGVTIAPPLTTTKGIVDTWASVALQPSILTYSNDPQVELNQANGVANEARWNFRAQNGFAFRLLNNAGTTATNIFGVGPNASVFNLAIPSIASAPGTTSTYSFAAQSNSPQIGLWNTAGAADMKRWDWVFLNATQMAFRACNDGGNSCGSFITATRTGNAVNALQIGHTDATVTTHVGQSFFTKAGGLNINTASVSLISAAPIFEISNSSAPGNGRRSVEYVDTSGTHHNGICQDSATCNDYMQVTRTGSSVTAVKLLTGNSTERFAIDSGGAIYASGQAGTAGQVLTSAGTGAPPTWTTPAAASVPVIKHGRATLSGMAINTSVDLTVTWSTPFADANYTVTCTTANNTPSALAAYVDHVLPQTAASVIATVRNSSGAALATPTVVNCIAIHD